MRKVFISYARVNRVQVDTLVEHLGMLDCQTWIDSSLRGGQQWWDEILGRIAECEVFLPVISHDALNSTACQREFDWAAALRKPVLPVAVEPPSTALPARFSMLQIVDYSNPSQRERAALTLAGALTTLPQAAPLPQPLPVPPAAPLSYLTDLVELVSGPTPLDHEAQHGILVRLEPALRSVDPHERQGALEILDRFGSRDNLYADVYRRLTWLKENTAPATGGVESPSGFRLPRRRTPTGATGGSSPTPQPVRQSAPTPSQPTAADPPIRKRSRVKLVLIAATVVVLAAAGVTGYQMWSHATTSPIASAQPTRLAGEATAPPSPSARSAASTIPAAQAVPTAAATPAAAPGTQSALPFTGLLVTRGVSVDTTGNVFAVDQGSLSELVSGATTSVQLPSTGLGTPYGLAVDTAGAVYIADYGKNAVWKLPPNATAPTIVPFDGLTCEGQQSSLGNPSGVAVDNAGNLYVTDEACQGRVLMLTPGAAAPTVLPFSGLNPLGAVAVDSSGSVYVTDGGNNAPGRVLKLAAGSTRPIVLPFAGLNNPQGVAVDGTGNVFVTDFGNKRVLKLAVGATSPELLPFTKLDGPKGVAVDGTGNVFVADANSVLKLAAG